MPGRQSHGRSLLASKPQAKNFRKSKAKAQAKALDAFTIASEQFPTKQKLTPRFRDIEGQKESGKKHRRDEDDDDEDDDEDGGDDDDDEQPRRKKVKPSSGGGGGDDDSEYGSDSEGNEWHYGVNDDEDSELDSDEAFGDSDQEDFQGYSFGGSKAAMNKGDDSEEEEDDDESLGEDAIDLAQALDEYESDESMQDREGSEGSDSDSDAEDSPPSSDSEDEDDEEADPSKLGALQKFITSYGGDEDDEAPTKQKQKISFKDLGLAGVKDAQMRKSVKLMAKEEKQTGGGGGGKKLEVPLARRQQDRLARAAAYEKANETIGRWQDTVKHNRRAEHLVFPLPQNAADEGLDNRELQAMTAKNAGTELEQTIMSIMQQSGLGMNKHEENRMRKEEAEEGMSKEALQDLVNQRRREREISSREAKRAARIKKIKSKAYHRVHRKEKEREEAKLHEAMAENGEIDSEAEREAADRARALERVGAKHRDSKWAKLGGSNKRAVWDDEYRAGLHDMARREEELRQRKLGRAGNSGSEDDDDEEDASSDDGDDGSDEEAHERRKLLKQLKRVEDAGDDDGPASKLMQMKFMQKAEAQQKKANDELIAQIRRDIASDGEGSEDEEETTEVGRKKFGGALKPAVSAPALSQTKKQKKGKKAADDQDGEDGEDVPDNSAVNAGYSITAEAPATGSAWSSGPRKKSSKGQSKSGARVADLDNSQAMTAAPAPKPKSKSKTVAADADSDSDADSEEDPDVHLPLAIRDIAQMDKAFAGDDVVVDFAREKAEIETADDDKVVDNTLPGWGGWVGEGVSGREKKRQQGRFVTKVEGVKKANRKDAKLDQVIISERRVKKNDKYLASQLPHPFESKAQYERSLRLPLGPEWVTKESFQDSIKPRILKKQGIIAPMSRPTL